MLVTTSIARYTHEHGQISSLASLEETPRESGQYGVPATLREDRGQQRPGFFAAQIERRAKGAFAEAGSGSEAGEIFAEGPEAAGHLRRAGETGEEAAGFGGHPGLLPAEAGLTADYADFLHAGAKG